MKLKHKTNAVILAAILLMGACNTVPYMTHETKQVQVLNTAVKNSQNESKYLAFTDAGVFENTDSWSYLKFNSSDVQAKLMQPGKYTISYYGFRIPFFSIYPNIIKAERVN